MSKSFVHPMNHALLFLSITLFWLPIAAQEQPSRPKITGIAHVRVYATNLENSRAFLTKMLGLPAGGGPCAGLTQPCFPVNEHQQIELQQAPTPAPANFLAEVAFATNDVAQMRRYLLAHSIKSGPISKDASGALHFDLRDPEGHPLSFVQLPSQPSNYRSSDAQVSSRLLHAGFVVKNPAVEDHFYRTLLGFRMYWHGGSEDSSNDDWIELQVPDGSDWIEYMLNVLPIADHGELGVVNHFALGVISMPHTFDRLKTNGLQTNEAPEIGRDGKWQFDIFDPDATRVEFMEFKPAQDPCCNPYEAAHPDQP
jgi:catechol 2,3-dioxygenase-like lactoylglutathione lyase family enzyme